MGTRSSSAKKMGMEGCTEEVLEQLNYPCASVHPGSGQGILHCHFVRDLFFSQMKPAQQ